MCFDSILAHAYCVSSVFVTVLRHQQEQFRGDGVYSGLQFQRPSWWGSDSSQEHEARSSHSISSPKAESGQAVGPGYKTSKPATSDICPSAELSFLNVPHLSNSITRHMNLWGPFIQCKTYGYTDEREGRRKEKEKGKENRNEIVTIA